MLSLSVLSSATQKPLVRAIAAGALIGTLGALASLSSALGMIEQQYGLGWLFRLRGPQPPPSHRNQPDSMARSRTARTRAS